MNRFISASLAAGLTTFSLVALCASSGCEAIGFVATTLDSETEVEFTAKYDGLNGKRIAVLVNAPLDAQYEHPTAVPRLCEYISAGLRDSCEGAKILPPSYAVAYQANNIYWYTMEIPKLAEALNVERLVIIDLVEYRLQAPGNSYLWDGMLLADVSVFEADGLDPMTPSFSERVKARYPSIDGVRREDAPQATVEQGLQIKFAQEATKLFYTYSRKKGDIEADVRKERHRL